jgi:hypothetical protein
MATPAVSERAELASDGSGFGDRLSSCLLFSLLFLLVGGVLLSFGRRGWRVTTGICLGLVLSLAAWAITVASMGDDRKCVQSEGVHSLTYLTVLGSSSVSTNGICRSAALLMC